jgi:hypothetical protein
MARKPRRAMASWCAARGRITIAALDEAEVLLADLP